MAPISAAFLITSLVALFMCVHMSASFAMRTMPLVIKNKRAAGRISGGSLQDLLSHIPPVAFFSSKHAARRRKDELRRALPDAIRLLCVSLESGGSLGMALGYAASNCSEPLATELKRAVWDIEAGKSFDEAFKSLRERTESPEFAFLAVAMEIQHRSGGSLTVVLDNLAALLRQSLELQEKLLTKTTQGRLSCRIVAVMPFVLLAVLNIFSPGYIIAFFVSPLGVCLFALALILEVVGVLLVKRCLAIDFTIDFKEAL